MSLGGASSAQRGGGHWCRPATLMRLWPLWLCLMAAPAAAELLQAQLGAQLEAQLDKARVAAGERVTLRLASDAPLPATLDLGPLAADFEVVGRRRAQSVSPVNGRRRERHELILTLLPRRSGQLSVPALTVGGARTPELALMVAEATSPQSRLLPAPTETAPPPADVSPQRISVSAEVTPSAGVVGEEFLITLRVRSLDGPPQGHLPTPQADGARLLPLGTSRSTDEDKAHVLVQRFSLFPQRPGTLAVTGIGFDAWQPAGGAPVRHRAEPLRISASPLPAGADTDTWLPARALTLTEAGPTEVRIAPGQGLERMITLRAEGLPAERLPAIPLGIPFQLRVQEDPPRLWNERASDGIVGYRTERVLISAAEAGSYVLPGPSLDWWDTRASAPRTATLPDWTLTVAPLASAERRPAARWARDQQAAAGDAGAPTSADGDAPSAQRSAAGAERDAMTGLPAWVMMLAAGVVLFGIVLWGILLWPRRGLQRRRRQRAPAPPDPAPPSRAAPPTEPDPDVLVAGVADAYARASAADARTALLAWGAALWPERPPGNLAQLMLRLGPPLRDDLKLLDKAFYGPDDGAWAKRPVAARLEALDVGSGAGAAGAHTTPATSA